MEQVFSFQITSRSADFQINFQKINHFYLRSFAGNNSNGMFPADERKFQCRYLLTTFNFKMTVVSTFSTISEYITVPDQKCSAD